MKTKEEFDSQVNTIVTALRDVPMEHRELPQFLMLYILDMSFDRGAICAAEREIERIRGWKRI